jgi:DNA topoisomerase I
MSKNLVIVESPAKAKTIESYLGKDYTVKSSFGHVRDLASKGLAIDIDKQFTPEYEVQADKKKLIQELKQLADKAETVWLASDEDREGEAIAWHLSQSLKLPESKTKRIVFNEITKTAILHAIEHPRSINYDLVNAQQARRVLDRLVGYELSPVLWKKVRPSLSAGRVQSVAVRLIVERERERQAFDTASYFRVTAQFSNPSGKMFRAELNRKLEKQSQAEDFLQQCGGFSGFKVGAVETKPASRTPSAPFTTSTLQQEASRKLGFSVARTMQVAQRLYESGRITYMRTDSVNLSDFALNAAAEAIGQLFGAPYHKKRQYSTKSKGAQEAHECIRPTDLLVTSAGEDASEKRLYELIWKRTLASQMADAQLEKTTVRIPAPGNQLEFQAKGEVIRFDGFLKLYLEGTDEEEDQENTEQQQLPGLKEGEPLSYKEILATQRFTQPPSRYTEASLVKKLEELGIGRPSTYAPTISTVQKRGYVVKEDREGVNRSYAVLALKGTQLTTAQRTEVTGAEKNKLFPTDIGTVVTDFLVDHFENILDYQFTARVEKEFDEIAAGKKVWDKMIEDFYGPFHQTVVQAEEISGRATGKRLLGNEAETGKPIYALVGKYGPMVQIGDASDEEKPRYASLRKDQSIQSISLTEALDLFALPKTLGQFEEKDVVVAVGRFGPYVKHNSKFVSIPKAYDPLDVSLEEAIQLIEEKRIADANRLIADFPGDPVVQILNGRWGPYIVVGKDNVKIPKGTEVALLTRDECLALHAANPGKPGKTNRKASAATEEPSAKKAVPAKKTASKKKAAPKKKTTATKKK